MGDFNVFTAPDHAEVVEEAVAWVLREDEELARFLDAVAILPDPFSEIAVPRPWIGVTAGTDSISTEPNDEGERLLDILIALVYDTEYAERQPGERGIKSAVQRIRRALFANPLLEGTEVSPTAPVVDRLDRLEVLRYDALQFEDNDVASAVIQLRVRFMFFIDLSTGDRA